MKLSDFSWSPASSSRFSCRTWSRSAKGKGTPVWIIWWSIRHEMKSEQNNELEFILLLHLTLSENFGMLTNPFSISCLPFWVCTNVKSPYHTGKSIPMPIYTIKVKVYLSVGGAALGVKAALAVRSASRLKTGWYDKWSYRRWKSAENEGFGRCLERKRKQLDFFTWEGSCLANADFHISFD